MGDAFLTRRGDDVRIPDGYNGLAVFKDKTRRAVNERISGCLVTVLEKKQPVYTLIFNGCGVKIPVSTTGDINIYDYNNGAIIQSLKHNGVVSSTFDVHLNIFAYFRDNTPFVYDFNTKTSKEFPTATNYEKALSISPSGNYLYVFSLKDWKKYKISDSSLVSSGSIDGMHKTPKPPDRWYQNGATHHKEKSYICYGNQIIEMDDTSVKVVAGIDSRVNGINYNYMAAATSGYLFEFVDDLLFTCLSRNSGGDIYVLDKNQNFSLVKYSGTPEGINGAVIDSETILFPTKKSFRYCYMGPPVQFESGVFIKNVDKLEDEPRYGFIKNDIKEFIFPGYNQMIKVKVDTRIYTLGGEL